MLPAVDSVIYFKDAVEGIVRYSIPSGSSSRLLCPKLCGSTVMSEHPTLEIGTRLGGRYELTEEIGEGGFGKIFRGRQLNIDRDVAVKVLPPKFSTVDNVVERFRREARLASRLRHPNTITIHDYGCQDDFFFIVMEYLEGHDLAQRLTMTQSLSLQKALHIGSQTLRSLREAHQRGIVHRDLKPENIFLTRMDDDTEYVKVLDFGIAKLATHDPELVDTDNERGRNLTIQGNTVGTPAYMSPEQAAGEDVDIASDLYTVGIILFEMVNGHPPFEKQGPVQTMRAHLFDAVPSFSNPELRGTRFEDVVLQALAKDPDHRYSDTDEFLEALSDPQLTTDAAEPLVLSQKKHEPSASTRASTDTWGDVGVSQKRNDEAPITDEVPFDVVPEEKPTEIHSPPPELATEGSVSSSIITVLDEPDDDDVIVLTDKKEDSSSPTARRAPLNSTASEPAATNDTNGVEVNGDTENWSTSGDEGWSWNETDAPLAADAADATGSQLLTQFHGVRRRRRMMLIGAIVLVTAAAAILALVFADLISIPL